jgi:expansin (peptidoglycan-binding protein)
MRSSVFTLLPLAGIALAESVCHAPEIVTVTEYEYASITPSVEAVAEKVTPSPSSVSVAATASSDVAANAVTPSTDAVAEAFTPTPVPCLRSTVTAFETEMVTVTVDAGEVDEVYVTSTQYITSTIWVKPSGTPAASLSDVPLPSSLSASSLSSSLKWSMSVYPNATYSVSASASTTSDLPSYPSASTTVLPEFSFATPTESPQAGMPSEAAAAPASATPAAAMSSPVAEAPQAPVSSAQVSASPASSETPASLDSSAVGSKRGQATTYGGNVAGGMCSFTGYTIPSSLYGTALSDANWAGAQACGQCISVTGPDGKTKITAMVVDQCPGCGTNHVDLFPDAFAKLAPQPGIIDVSWDFVPCGITTPIVLKNKEGTSANWFSMQVMNANVGVSTLEVSIDGGATWKPTVRQPYNFFEYSSGFGKTMVDVKVTSIGGKSVVVKGVSVAANSKTTAGGNF